MWIKGKDRIQESTLWPGPNPGIITGREIHGGHESIQYIQYLYGTGALFLMVIFPTFIIPTLQYSIGAKFLKFKIPNGSKFLMVQKPDKTC
jgi:hypothetical protein